MLEPKEKPEPRSIREIKASTVKQPFSRSHFGIVEQVIEHDFKPFPALHSAVSKQTQNQSFSGCGWKPFGRKIINHGAFSLNPNCAAHFSAQPIKSATELSPMSPRLRSQIATFGGSRKQSDHLLIAYFG